MNRIYNLLVSPITMALILLIGIIAMASATFIENDFGAEVARKAVYNARWFEVLMVLFSANLIGSIFKRKLYKKQKFSIFLFHIAFIIMIFGAALTRYVGYEGLMHIREEESSSIIKTQNKSLNISIEKSGIRENFSWDESKVLRKTGFSDNFKFDNSKFEIELKYFYPNAKEKAIQIEGGKPTIGFVVANTDYRGFNYITEGETKILGNVTVGFGIDGNDIDVCFSKIGDSVYISSKNGIAESDMDQSDATNGIKSQIPVSINKLYATDGNNVVVQEIYKEALIAAFPNRNANKAGKPAFVFNIKHNGLTEKLTLWGNGAAKDKVEKIAFDDILISGSYGKHIIKLPFELHLDNFEVKRYPGSNSPSSFSSYVHIIESDKEPKPFHIYMNNILQMEGYRFYQSSYDNDEKGTVLSVNFDSLGTNVTYIGYFLLLIGILLSMVNKTSFLRNTKIPKTLLLLLSIISFSLLTSGSIKAQNNSENTKHISTKHAQKFGQLLIQDNKGRTEPIYTFSSDLLRKLARKDKMYNLTPVQIFLGMNTNYEHWMNVPLIKITNKELQTFLGLRKNYASYNDFLTPGVGYKLQGKVEKAYNTPPGKQSKFDKAIIKADERMNICYAIFSGSFLKLFPIPESDNEQWYPMDEAIKYAKSSDDSAFFSGIIPMYFQALQNATLNGNYKKADDYLASINSFQQKFAAYELPSDFKINLEVKYYQWNIFKKLFPFYATIGVIFLFVLLSGIISGKGVSKKVTNVFVGLISMGFILHTLGLAARWYISGHAPMSNGYESMVFISLITMLAGLIFSRQSLLALSATSVLAGFTLMVANLSFMDPEITNLVPVLKSYWLTIHVSVITGSYGFLGLGAILGIINLVLTIIQNKQNFKRIDEAIHSLTTISHRSLILGLYFLTIGTFLGAVWANESWGRYWGWDPKETWSLITLIIYTFVTHARMVPGIKGVFAFNTLSVYAFFSVLMTYFGVNYYLSGLHSYAAGDPVPVPNFVYISVALIITLTVVAYFRFIKNRIK
jgi:cytochrome c-type biogenesis protein CcsB